MLLFMMFVCTLIYLQLLFSLLCCYKLHHTIFGLLFSICITPSFVTVFLNIICVLIIFSVIIVTLLHMIYIFCIRARSVSLLASTSFIQHVNYDVTYLYAYYCILYMRWTQINLKQIVMVGLKLGYIEKKVPWKNGNDIKHGQPIKRQNESSSISKNSHYIKCAYFKQNQQTKWTRMKNALNFTRHLRTQQNQVSFALILSFCIVTILDFKCGTVRPKLILTNTHWRNYKFLLCDAINTPLVCAAITTTF